MRRLILKLLLFPLPLAVFFAFPAWVFLAAGEWTTLDTIVKAQQSARPMLIGLAYSDPQFHMKLQAVKERRPQVISLGTSRVMEFRDDFFNRSFYNAGCGTKRFENIRKFLDHLGPDEQPQLIILGLDQKFFNPDWEKNEGFSAENMEMLRKPAPRTEWLRMLFYQGETVYQDWFKHKFRISELGKPRTDGILRIGMTALVRNAGLRNDGSYQWYQQKDDADGLKDITLNKGIYTRNRMLSKKGLAEVDVFLEKCQRRGIKVAGFLPPFSPRIYKALETNKEEYAYVFRSAEPLRAIFKRYGFAFEDFTDPAPFDAENTGYVDDQHLSEEGYRRMWSLWTEKEPALRPYAG